MDSGIRTPALYLGDLGFSCRPEVWLSSLMFWGFSSSSWTKRQVA